MDVDVPRLFVIMVIVVGLLGVTTPPSDDGPGPSMEPRAVVEEGASQRLRELVADLPGSFTENRGQLGDEAGSFYCLGEPLSVAFGRGWVLYDLREGGGDEVRCHSFRVTFEGAYDVVPVGKDPRGHLTNHFDGSRAEGWVTGAPSYGRVVYEGLWDGVDLSFRAEPGEIKYEFLVSRGGDPRDISLRYHGMDDLWIDPSTGDLMVSASLGIVRDRAPVAFQGCATEVVEVPVDYSLTGDAVSFDVGTYSPDMDLVIDPGLLYSTYFGTSSFENQQDIAIDEEGRPILVGTTGSASFPTTEGAYCITAPPLNIFVVRLETNYTAISYSTLIGSAGNDMDPCIKLDDDGNVVMTGLTGGLDFPTTPGAYNTSTGPLFVLKLNASGDRLHWSTMFPVRSYDTIYSPCIALDAEGGVHVGCSLSRWADPPWIPTTPGVLSEDPLGNEDGFLFELRGNGTELGYSTFIGGSGNDIISDVCVDEEGDVFITGASSSSDLPLKDPFQTARAGGFDAFLLKLDGNGSQVLFGSFLGGSRTDVANSISVDGGTVHLVGTTGSLDFPVSSNAYQSTINRAHGDDRPQDAFMSRIDPGTSTLSYSTYLGGLSDDEGTDLVVDEEGMVYILGTAWYGFPTTGQAFCQSHTGGYDFFLSKLNIGQSRLEYSTYIGGSGYDWRGRLAMDRWDCLHIVGDTYYGNDYPTTADCMKSFRQGQDLIYSVLDLDPPVINDSTPASGTTGEPVTFNATVLENRMLERVEVEVWRGGSISHENLSMDRVQGEPTNGTWERTYNLSADSVEALHYILRAVDQAGHVTESPQVTINVTDNDEVQLTDMTNTTITTGDPFDLEVFAEDNIGVKEVRALMWYGDAVEDAVNRTMDLISGTHGYGNGTYGLHDVLAAVDSLVPFHYRFSARDRGGLWASSDVYTLPVLDNDGPSFLADLSQSHATTGDVFVLRANVSDNVGIEAVTVLYWFNDHQGEAFNVSMEPESGNGGASGVYVNDHVVMPSGTVGMLVFQFYIEDTSGNWLLSLTLLRNLRDNDGPEVLKDSSDTVATTGDPYHFLVEVGDNLGVANVELVYWFTGLYPVIVDLPALAVSDDGNGSYGTTIAVPNGSNASVHYLLELTDISGNTLRTEEREVPVLDDEPPTFGTDLSAAEAVRDHTFSLYIEVEDNIGVTELWCEHWIGEGEHVNSSMPPDTTIDTDIPLYPEGPLHYFFSARDAAGNWNGTQVFERPVPNRPPVLVAPELWEVGEEVDSELNLMHSVEDPDGPWDAMVMGCGDPNVTVTRLILQLRHDIWVPDYVIQVWVTDGESTSWANITVRVVPVNDDPVITQILRNGNSLDPSVEVLTLRRGGDDDLHVRATDEDGDDLSYRWLRDGQVVATGDTVRAEDLPLGSYILRVEVDDGTEIAAADLAVQVTEREEETTSSWIWTLLIIIIVLLVVGFVYWRSRDRTI